MANTTSPPDNTNRFSGLATAYTQYRDAYPPAVISFLASSLSLPPAASSTKPSIIADLGSGTGRLSGQLLDHFHRPSSDVPQNDSQDVQIIGVEPNTDMRAAQTSVMVPWTEKGLFRAVGGTAEATGLDEQSVGAVVAGAAFHWFDGPGTRKEVLRIVQPNEDGERRVGLLTRARPEQDSSDYDDENEAREVEKEVGKEAIARGREAMEAFRALRHDLNVNHTIDVHERVFSKEALDAFFGEDGWWKIRTFPLVKEVTWEKMKGEMSSMSVVPKQGTTLYEKVMAKAKEVFDKFEKGGVVEMTRTLAVYYGSIA